MAIYAFDGTGNEDNPDDGKDTNVLKFYNAYNDGYTGSGECLYLEGVGTRMGFIGAIFGSLFGAGGQDRVDEAIDALEENFSKGDERIDIIGFSRGSALALEFANKIHDHGINGKDSPPINFIGIWDTVASFGIPGNNVNLGYTLSVPKNVEHCFHAIALDERRQGFPLTRVAQNAYTGRNALNINEVWFRGFHSDVGGGNENEGLSSISLVWMFKRAMNNAIIIPIADLSKHEALRDSMAECKKPRMDLIPNKKRTINHTDVVHDSVSRRDLAAKGFDANNPPKGLSVVGAKGEILPNGFEGA